ncbi:MAG TPA: phage holin family protein [Micromonosporaceae bacterium]
MSTSSPAWNGTPAGARESQSVGDLINEVAGDLSRLFRQEVELAKTEIKEEAGKAGKAGGMLSAAAVAGLLVAVLLSFALVYALAEVMPAGWAALIVAVIWAIAGFVLYREGRRRLTQVSPVPRQTMDTLKEDMQWLRNPTG